MSWAALKDRVKRELGPRERRIIAAAWAGFLFNLLYALYHGALGLLDRSVWFVTMCAYYIVLAVMRLSAVLYSRKADQGDGAFIARLFGAMLILLSVVLAGVNYLSLSQNIATRHGTIVMITITTYTFTKITMAVVRAVRARRDSSALFAAIRCVGYAEVATALFTMQRSMIVSFSETGAEDMRTLNILTGTVVWLFVFALGVYMARKKG